MTDLVLQQFKKAFEESQLSFEPHVFYEYLQLLHKWNKTYNLTAVRNIEDMIYLHIIDSLLILPFIKGKNIIDVGSGAGLPGIVLALANKDLNVFLLESNGKKINFLLEAKRILCLDNVTIVHDRVENYTPLVKFDTVVTRAFANILKMLNLTKHLIADDGIYLAMKGEAPKEALDALKTQYEYETVTYMLEKINANRSAIIIKHKI